jgi:hypothetical protein
MNLLVLAGVWLTSAGQNLAKGGGGAEGLGWGFNAEFNVGWAPHHRAHG